MKSSALSKWSLFPVLSLYLAAVLFFVLAGDSEGATDWGTRLGPVFYLPLPLAFVVVGALIRSRHPRNAVGWIAFAMGSIGVLGLFGESYAIYSFGEKDGALPLDAFSAWVAEWSWVGLFGPSVHLILLFPDGRPPSPRWRWVAWAGAAGIAAAFLSIGFRPGRLTYAPIENPFAAAWAEPLLEVLNYAIALIPIGLLAAAASLVVRYRRSRGDARLQLKWLTSAVAVVAVFYFLAVALSAGSLGQVESESDKPPLAVQLLQDFSLLTWLALPAAVGIAILKYRLFDIDVVINKAVVYGVLAGFITALYVGIVVGIGQAVGTGAQGNLGLSITATAAVAVAFQPVKSRVQHVANRLVYGKRATPYEVLSDFSSKMAGAYAADQLLSEIARTLAEGTAAVWAQVWLKLGDELRLSAAHPPEVHGEVAPESVKQNSSPEAGTSTSAGEEEIRVAADNTRKDGMVRPGAPVFDVPGADWVAEVLHQGDVLGALAVKKRPGEFMTSVEQKLLEDLASQAGVVLRNVRLNEELRRRLEELQASRQRLVAAQDEERRRLERDLHDGAQQQLVGLKMKLSLAQRVATEQKVKDFLTQLQTEADETLQTLRDLARGIYPPLLAEQGLVSALRAQANKSMLAIEVQAEGVGRYSQEAEAAVYFCCLEALQNVAKYAEAKKVVMELAQEGGFLQFSVSDDGAGFNTASQTRGSGLQNMADRMDALGGWIKVTSQPGAGTTLEGQIPISASAKDSHPVDVAADVQIANRSGAVEGP